ncbi:cyclin-dependent kinase inhibitor 1-like [Anopheles nili]|uniref:cyclin-dependent kinase inhibitor 1-like n=1 Tax=Anopheles nili TaxID=185578 RepID=UPI00237A9698|nr:cyclin-dependent kinase inhibitor 1-like [Anopheles nili]
MGAQVYNQRIERLRFSPVPQVSQASRKVVGARRIKRNLFGSVKAESVKEIFNKVMDEHVEQKSKTWNFNFAKDEPMNGRFKWEHLAPPNVEGLRLQESRRANRIDEVIPMEVLMDERAELANKGTRINVTNSAMKQLLITDYMKPRKRTHGRLKEQ